jgi:dipeptidyl aminopeptidase/acylaminoacyl peptidase/CubicO group peptidase (beta-lactamase class C family)
MTRHQRIDDLTAIAVPEQPVLSPDGRHCVYVLRTSEVEQDRTVRSIWCVGLRPGTDAKPRRLTRGPADSAPSWSPDGTRIAFLRAQDGPAQLWLLPFEGGEAEQVTTLPLGAGAAVWSPDGARIAFGAPVDIEAVEGEDDAARTRRAAAPIVTERLDHQADGTGALRSMRLHLHLLDPVGRGCRQITSGDWHAGAPAWSPDGGTLAFAAATAPDADLTVRAPVHLLDVGAGAGGEPVVAEPRAIGLFEGMGGPITWTTDGNALLVVGTEGSPLGHAGLLRIPLSAGRAVDLAGPLDLNVMPGGPGYPGALPQLSADGRNVLFCARHRGCTHLYQVSVDQVSVDAGSGQLPVCLVCGLGRTVSGLSVAGDTAVFVLATATSFGEVVSLDLSTGTETVRTEHGAALAEIELFARQEREFVISDGTLVHGWLIRDPGLTAAGPLLLDIHGGPHNAWNGAADEVHLYHQELAAQGWTVLLLNPRGSDGYGEEFFNAGIGAWGRADANDFLEPIDTLVEEGIADPKRLAVTGYSYGGFMTCYLTGRDQRFAAAVAGGLVSDLTSLAGTSDAGHLMAEHELGGPPWAEPERYQAMSPLSQVERVRTPTLILHGADDLRCPVGQAEQWHTALREQGVPAQLVLYPAGSHLFILEGPPSHRIDFNRRVADWVQQYAGAVTGPARPRIDAAHWQRRLTTLARRHGVPGAALGIMRMRPGSEDEQVQAAFGVLNADTAVATTTDSVFQIGSISKVWTTTVVMQLVDEGLLDLDAPILQVLPELRLMDAEVTAQVTMRHLLTHTSGIDGDVFTDTGRGDDCLEKYVELLLWEAQNHPLAATWSYCNSGFVLAGRVIEKLTGLTWDAALRERLFEPLGLTRTGTLPEDALLHRAAVGHVGDTGDGPVRAPVWTLPRSVGPAGLISSSVADVLSFARMHLSEGLAADGKRVLSAAAVEQMASHQAKLPDEHTLGDSWGLGWIRMGWDGHRLIGHDGNTIGQSAYLRLLPEQGLAVTLLTNGHNTRDLYADLYREIFAELAGVAVPAPLEPPAAPVPVNLDRHLGTYERSSVRMEVLKGEQGAVLRSTITGPLAELVPDTVEEYPMVALEQDLFLVRAPESSSWMPVTFYELATGERYLHFGVRATPKVD